MNTSNKGNTDFDHLCHTIMGAENDGFDYLARSTGISCGKCGHKLKTYYCEERLYMVDCEHCGVKCLVEAGSPAQACYKTMAYQVKPVEQISEEREAVFWGLVPICEYPDYHGHLTDPFFPDYMVCGTELPFLGTDGEELEATNEK